MKSYVRSDGRYIYVDETAVPRGDLSSGYYLAQKKLIGYTILDYLGVDCINVTITTDKKGFILCASPVLEGKLDSLIVSGLESRTTMFEFPIGLLDKVDRLLPGFAVQDEFIVYSYSLCDEKDVYVHSSRLGNKIIGFGGLCAKPSTFVATNTDTIIRFVEGKVHSYIPNDDIVKCETMWLGAGTYRFENIDIIVKNDTEDGDMLVVPIPKALLSDRSVKYYPIAPDGTEYYSIERTGTGSVGVVANKALSATIQQEVLTNITEADIPAQYVEAVSEILSKAPEAYISSETPLLSALEWALAERRGRM